MSITLDAAAQSTNDTSSPVSWSHTIGSGSDRLIMVGVCLIGMFAGVSCTGVTCGGTAMTKVTSQSAGYIESSVWILHAPGTGSKTIEASFSGMINCGYGCSVSYFGAQQSSTADSYGGGKCTSSCTTGSKTYTVTTVADNCWIFGIGAARVQTYEQVSLNANETSRGFYSGGTGHVIRAEDSNGALTPAGDKTPGFTIGGTNPIEFAMCFAAFAPSALPVKPLYAYAQQ